MPVQTADLVRLRPFVFHTSDLLNFQVIRRTRELRSATTLLHGRGFDHLLRGRRPCTVVVELPEGPVSVRDHKPLRPGSVRLLDCATLDDYIDELNRRVFFWLGNACGPNRRGQDHAASCARGGEVFTLRAPLRSLLAANAKNPPFLARCNSGAARHHNGQPATRGPSTFRLLADADFRASAAIELSFVGSAVLPADSEYSSHTGGPWELLWP